MESTCAFTGHRPSRFHFGYDEKHPDCLALKQVLHEETRKLIEAGVVRFLTGMAVGVDMWAALAVLEFKRVYPQIKLVAVRPCESQADRWPAAQQHIYYNILLPGSNEIVLLQQRYTSDCMPKRNRYLVDRAQQLLAVHDGSERGGTAYTVNYAFNSGRDITVIRPDSLQVIPPAKFQPVQR